MATFLKTILERLKNTPKIQTNALISQKMDLDCKIRGEPYAHSCKTIEYVTVDESNKNENLPKET